MRIQSSRPIALDRPWGVRGVEVGVISMMTDSITMIGVKCPLHHQEVGRTPLDSKMTYASTVLGKGSQSTPENQALT